MNLKNCFLIAMPQLDDPFFARSVVYICEHNNEGAMGLIINKPIETLDVETVLQRLDITINKKVPLLSEPIFVGGPMSDEQGFILHTPKTGLIASEQLTDDIMMTTSIDVLGTISTKNQPENMFIALGYAMWAENQLESEIAQNDWLVADANLDILFNTPYEQRWHEAAKKLGINIETISTVQGKA